MSDEAYHRAIALIARDKWVEAAREIAPGIAGPSSPGLLALAAEVSLRFGAYSEASELARRAASTLDAPLDAVVALRVARVFRRLELSAELEQLLLLQAPRGWPPRFAAEIAVLASSASLFKAGDSISSRFLAEAPRSADAHYVAGLLAMFDGDRDRSLAHLAQALVIEPRMGNAHWLVAMQDGPSGAAAHVDAMRRALAGVVGGTEAETYLQFSLHRRLHELGRYAEAWDALHAGLRTARHLTPYDELEERRLFDALGGIDLPTRSIGTSESSPRLIFIVGMFRSGTTLIERVLTGHPDVVDGGETYQFTAAFRESADVEGHGPLDLELVRRAHAVDFATVRERFMAYARWRTAGRRVLTEKLPSNYLNIPFILRALPDATIVHLRRDPMDTCFSNLRTYFRGAAPYSNSLEEMARHYRRYARLMEHWQSQAPDRIVEVDYASFVASPEVESRRLLDACGLSGEMARRVDASPLRSTTASAADVGKGFLANRGQQWRHYAAQLDGMRTLLDA